MVSGVKHNIIAIIVIVAIGGLAYSNVLHAPFVFDDLNNIVENRSIRIDRIDLASLYEAGFQSPSARRPVANISFAINHMFGGYDVAGYHWVNIIIHIVNAILVYILSAALVRDLADGRRAGSTGYSSARDGRSPLRFIPLLSALVFVAHPIQIQSVTYIVQRMSSMAAMFYLIALLAYRYGRTSPRRGRRIALWTLGFLSWLLALGTKENAATLPAVILMYEWYVSGGPNREWLRKNRYVIGVALLLVAMALAYISGPVLDRIAASYDGRDFTWVQRVLTQPRVIAFYVSLLLFPHPARFSLLHPITTSQSLIDPLTTLLSAILILLAIGYAIVRAARHRVVSFCILWFFIHLAIESSVLGLEMVFEHRLYLPMVGFSLLSA